MPSTFINNLPHGVTFLSQLPDEIVIQTDNPFMNVYVAVDGSNVYNSRLYAVNSKIYIYNIKDIARQYAETNESEEFVQVAIEADNFYTNLPQETITSNAPYIIPLNKKYYGDAEEFIIHNFLRKQSAKKLSLSQKDTLYAALYERESSDIIFQITYLSTHTGEITTDNYTVGHLDANAPRLASIAVSYAICESKIQEYECIQSCTVVVGQRSQSYFFADFTPTHTFQFRNAFNVPEILELEAVTEVHTEMDKQIAISNQSYLTYDVHQKNTHESTTAPLNGRDATWIEEFISSSDIRILDENLKSDAGEYPIVLITESTCRVANDDKELTQVKFSWIYQSAMPVLYDCTDKSIFTKEYNQSFT